MTAADGLFFAADSPTSPQIIGGLVLLSAVGGAARPRPPRPCPMPFAIRPLRSRPAGEAARPVSPLLRRPHGVGGPPDADAVRSACCRTRRPCARGWPSYWARPSTCSHRPWSLDVFASPGEETPASRPRSGSGDGAVPPASQFHRRAGRDLADAGAVRRGCRAASAGPRVGATRATRRLAGVAAGRVNARQLGRRGGRVRADGPRAAGVRGPRFGAGRPVAGPRLGQRSLRWSSCR